MGFLIYSNDITAYSVDCGLKTMQAIYFLEISVQDLTNRGMLAYVVLLHATDKNCSELYKAVQHQLHHNKTKLDDSRVIDLITLKNNTMTN